MDMTIIKGTILGMKSVGIEFEKSLGNTVYISLPKEYEKPHYSDIMTPEYNAKRAKDMLNQLSCEEINVKYRIRDEVWTGEKSDMILKRRKS